MCGWFQYEVITGGLEATEAIVARSRDEVRGSLRVSCPPQLPSTLSPRPLITFLTRYPLVRVQLHLSNLHVDLINERDIAAPESGYLYIHYQRRR